MPKLLVWPHLVYFCSMAGLYLHIPFCKQACHYCDFHFSTNLSRADELVDAMAQEIRLQKGFFGPVSTSIETVYLGGGTPSLLTKDQLKRLFTAIHSNFQISPNAEVTLEANPDDISSAALESWIQLGVNRLSIGIQTFDQAALAYCNRAHNATEAMQAVQKAQAAGIYNISIDLMYGIPISNTAVWDNDIRTALGLGVPHISAYCLTVEPKTTFGHWAKIGKLTAIDEDIAAQQYDTLVERLKQSGYEHYEVSNFALPGKYAIHNTNYWRYHPYLGIGPSAHTFDGQNRYANVANNIKYISGIQIDPDNKTVWRSIETLTGDEKIGEYLLTSLRTQWGADLIFLKDQLGYHLGPSVETMILGWVADGLADYISGQKLILTDAGRLLADHLTLKLLP